MSPRSFKQKLSHVHKLWEDEQYDEAVAKTEELRTACPGNANLLVIWASLVQLQEEPTHSLEEVRHALEQAVEFDEQSPAAAIELGRFLDSVEDNPQAASKIYADAVTSARRLLMDGLLAQARAFLQLDKQTEAISCLIEALHLTQMDSKRKGKGKNGSKGPSKDQGSRALKFNLTGPFAPELEGLLSEVFPSLP